MHTINNNQSTLFLPLRIATSKAAVRTYITSILFFATSLFTLALAIAAYTAFYWSYIPRIGFTRQVHLQFDDFNQVMHTTTATANAFLATPTPETEATVVRQESIRSHPWGTINLAPDMVSQQLYDITVHLTLPRTPENTAQGNFMLDASLLGPSPPIQPLQALLGTEEAPVLARSRRSAILTYYSREIDLARKALRLPTLLTGLSQEVEKIDVQLFEGVEFSRGQRNVPTAMKLEVQSRACHMQIYSCSVSFRARFRGLRWIMYNHRLASAIVFVFAFWMMEVAAISVALIALSMFVFPKVNDAVNRREKSMEKDRIKHEEHDDVQTPDDDSKGDMSDTERTFPSYGGAPAMRYSSPETDRKIKREEESVEPFPALPADDEEEDDDFVLDSGLGTSLESSAGGAREAQIRRRKSQRERAGS